MWQGHKIGTVCVTTRAARADGVAPAEPSSWRRSRRGTCTRGCRLHPGGERALRLQTERLHALIDTANAPIFAVDQRLRLGGNNKIAELLSLPKRDAVVQVDEPARSSAPRAAPTRPRVPPAEGTPAAAAALRTFQDVLARGLDGEACACVGLELPPSAAQPDGVELQLSVAPQWDDARSAVTAVVCVAEDVRARNQIMRAKVETVRLQEVNEAKDAFLACMSHEMRTPLNGLLGMLSSRWSPTTCRQRCGAASSRRRTRRCCSSR